MINLDRLQAQLLNSPIHIKDNPLYQVITQLIKAEKELQDQLASSVTTINNIINNLTFDGPPPVVLIGLDSSEPFDPIPIPGKDGKDGKQGLIGPPGEDGTDGNDSFIPGSPSRDGRDGQVGIPGLDGQDGESSLIPGLPGRDGKDGLTIPGMDGENYYEDNVFPATAPSSGGSSTSPGGSDTQVQFNDSGAFGGDAGLVYNKTTDILSGPTSVRTANSTAATPGFSHNTDTNTGLFLDGSDTLGLTTSGVSRLGVNSTGGCNFTTAVSHAIGGIPNLRHLLTLLGAFTGNGTGIATALRVQPSIAGAVGDEVYGMDFAYTFVDPGSGTTPAVGGLICRAPIRTGTGATITEAATLYIDGAPSFGSANYGIKAAGGIRFTAFGAGAATFDASGNISSVSDEKFKENIKLYNYGLAAIRKLEPIRYKWTLDSKLDRGRSYIGFSAQSVRPWIPDAVDAHRRTGDLSLNPHVIIAAMVNAIKELAIRVDSLDNKKENDATPIVDFNAAIELDSIEVARIIAEEDETIRRRKEIDDRELKRLIEEAKLAAELAIKLEEEAAKILAAEEKHEQ